MSDRWDDIAAKLLSRWQGSPLTGLQFVAAQLREAYDAGRNDGLESALRKALEVAEVVDRIDRAAARGSYDVIDHLRALIGEPRCRCTNEEGDSCPVHPREP